MNTFKAFLAPVGLAAMLALPLAANAQTAPAPAPNAPHADRGHHGGFMHAMQGLNLTADQQARIKALAKQFHQNHPKGSPPDAAARDAFHQQIMSILTPAQQAQFKANLAQMHPGMEAPENGERGGQRGAGMMRRFDALNLSADQKARIQTIMQQFRQAHPPGSPRDPQAMASLRDQIKAVLTPQQQQQLEQQMHDRDRDNAAPPASAPPRN